MKIRPMLPNEEYDVRMLHRRCHPGWPERPEGWYIAYPTLVAEQAGSVVGFTSLSLSSMTGLLMIQGADICVDRTVQRQGVGLALHRERLRLGHAVGATIFSGLTQPGNAPMQRIFLACGHHACQTVKGYFPDGQDGVLYLGPITE